MRATSSRMQTDPHMHATRESSARNSRRQQRGGQQQVRDSRNRSRADSAAMYSANNYVGRRSNAGRGSKKKRIALIVVIALVAILAGVGVAGALWYNNIASNLRGNNNITATTAATADEPYYVLLLGGDSREGDVKTEADEGNRTDSMMVARVDEKNKKVDLLSVPRDTRVYIEGHGHQKINSAIEFGGYDLAIKEVNELLGIKINYYAFIYFSGFEDLVDKLGGVTVEVPEGTEYAGVRVPAGDAVTINGQEALVLARCRHGVPADQGAYAMGEYQRTLNQRNLIKAIGKKILESDATKMPDLITGLSECVETNMDISRIIQLASNMRGMDLESDLVSRAIPEAGATIDGAWYGVIFQDLFPTLQKNFIAGKDPYDGFPSSFDIEHIGDECGTGNYTDGPIYSYTNYQTLLKNEQNGTISTGSSSSSKSSSYDDDDDYSSESSSGSSYSSGSSSNFSSSSSSSSGSSRSSRSSDE